MNDRTTHSIMCGCDAIFDIIRPIEIYFYYEKCSQSLNILSENFTLKIISKMSAFPEIGEAKNGSLEFSSRSVFRPRLWPIPSPVFGLVNFICCQEVADGNVIKWWTRRDEAEKLVGFKEIRAQITRRSVRK